MWCSDLVVIKKSRKNHRCDWCGETIITGDSYSRSL